MPKLTKRFVDSLARPPAGRDLYVWDSEVRGFGYRLKANGTGAWIFQYRKHGISRRLTIGSYPGGGSKTPTEARDEAEALRGEVRKGDPARDGSRGKRGLTVAGLCQMYLDDAEKGPCSGQAQSPQGRKHTRHRSGPHRTAHQAPNGQDVRRGCPGNGRPKVSARGPARQDGQDSEDRLSWPSSSYGRQGHGRSNCRPSGGNI